MLAVTGLAIAWIVGAIVAGRTITRMDNSLVGLGKSVVMALWIFAISTLVGLFIGGVLTLVGRLVGLGT